MAGNLLLESRARWLVASHLTKKPGMDPHPSSAPSRRANSDESRKSTRDHRGLRAHDLRLSYSLPSFGADVTASPTPDGKEAKKIVEPPKPPEPRFKIYGWIEAGITGNPDSPTDNHNFGHLFTDRANEPLLNQAVITAERALDPNATGFDWGFRSSSCMAAMLAIFIRSE